MHTNMSLLRAAYGRGVRIVQRENLSRAFSLSSACNDKPVASQVDKTSDNTLDDEKLKNPMSILHEGTYVKVNDWEKKMLVWTGKYKRIEDVPPKVPHDTMDKARNKGRIKIANYMILATVVGCIGFVYSGKQAAKRGESVQKMNMDWHQEIKEASQKEPAK